MKPADRGNTGSLATCIPPSLRGHLVGTVVGNFVGNFGDTFVSISVSVFVYTFLLMDAFVAHVKFSVYKTHVFYFVEFSWATQWPVSGGFRGLSGLQERLCGQPRRLAS